MKTEYDFKIRPLPKPLYEALKARELSHGISRWQIVVAALSLYLGLETQPKQQEPAPVPAAPKPSREEPPLNEAEEEQWRRLEQIWREQQSSPGT